MASNLRVDSIVPATGSSVSIGTATGGVNIPGVLTYEDVTNVDSVGVITARSGINVSGGGVDITTGGLVVTGISTTTARLDVGNNGTNAVDLRFRSNRASAGQTIANLNYEWNGTTVAQIRGIAGSDTTNKDDGHLAFYTTPAGSGSFSERLRIGSAGQLGIGGANYGTSGQVLTSQGSGSPIQWATISTPLVAYKAKEYARSRYSFSNGTWAEIDNAFRIVHTPAATGNTIIIHTQVYHTIADNSYGGFANVTDQGSGSNESMLGETGSPSAIAKGSILGGNYYNEGIRQNSGGTIGLGSNLWGYHVTENTNAHTFFLFARMGSGTRYIGDNQPAQFMEMWEYSGNVMQ